jgi:3-hydroxymyristoyl/3-hydroxydecanoyl-(acyl carrier protein) dehydratase
MRRTAKLHFAGNHPTAAGHFPGNPIIPGAVLLDEILATITGDDGPMIIRSVKFLAPVRPGDSLDLHWETSPSGALKFECRPAGEASLVLTGLLDIGQVAP